MVTVLGFGGEAEENGGYPNGYLNTAGRIKLLRDAASEDDGTLLRGQAFKLIYNALDADRLVNLSYGENARTEISSQTLRDILLGTEEDGLAYFKGTVTANYDSWTISPRASIKENEVEIDGVIFDKGITDAERYLGCEVNVYAAITEDDGTPVIKQIRPSKNNDIVDLDFDDIVSADRTQIKYQVDGEKNATVCKLKNSTVVLYNGRPVLNIAELNIKDMKDGSVRLISNTSGDDYAHTVLVNEYKSVTADRVNETDERIFLNTDDRVNGLKYIDLSKDDRELKHHLMNSKGETIGLDEVKSGEIITVYSSLDGNLLNMYTCGDEFSGTVTELYVEDGKITVSGEVYEYEKNVDVSSLMGKEVSGKLNYLGKIASLEKASDAKELYCAIVKLHTETSVGGELKARVVMPGKIIDEEEESDDPSVKSVPLIAAQNSEVKVLTFNSKVVFNDVSYGSTKKLADAINTAMGARNYLPVSYSLNSEGLIRKIESLEEYTVLQNTKQYNAYEKTFSGSGGAFGLDAKTLAFCIPTNTVSSNDDYLARIEMNNDQNYAVSAYSYNKDTHCPDVVAFHADMYYDTPGITSNTKRIGVIEKVSSFYDDGDHKMVVMSTPDGIGDYEISENTSSGAAFSTLKAGDVIVYSLDGNDRLDGFTLLASCRPIPADYKASKTNFEIFSGETVDAEYKVVSNNLNKWVDTITVSGFGLDNTVFEVQRDNPPPVYIWNSARKNVTIGTADDFLINQKHVVIIKESTGKLLVRAIVIII